MKLPLGRWEAQDVAPLVSLAVLVIFFAFAADGFLQVSTLVTLLEQGSVLAMVAVGLTFVLLAGEIDLGVGMVALWTASLCGWLFREFAESDPALLDLQALFGGGVTLRAWLALAGLVGVPLLSSLAFGAFAGVLTIESRLPSFIITLAIMNIADGAARFLTRSETLPVPQLLKEIGNGGWELFAGVTLPYNAVLAAVIFLVGHVVLVHLRFGRYVYMTGGNREAARLAGVRTGRIVTSCLAISAFTAGIAGLVNAGRIGSISQDQNRDLLLSAVACVVLGGTSLFGGEGSMGKTLVGVATFTVLKVGLNHIDQIDDLARTLLTGLVLLTALVINGVLTRTAPRGSAPSRWLALLKWLRIARR